MIHYNLPNKMKGRTLGLPYISYVYQSNVHRHSFFVSTSLSFWNSVENVIKITPCYMSHSKQGELVYSFILADS